MHQTDFPSTQRKNLIDVLISELQEQYNETDNFADSFARVALNWLGYDIDQQVIFVDGWRDDRGIDAYVFSDENLKLFQFKSQDFTRSFDRSLSAGADIVADTSRILSLLQTKDSSSEAANSKVRQLLSRLQSALSAYNADSTKDDLFSISIYTVAMYDGLTPSARSELKRATKYQRTDRDLWANCYLQDHLR